MNHAITIRRSVSGDEAAISRLALLDSGHAPFGDALLGFVEGELRVALPVDGGRPLADPFHPTAEVLELLRACLAQDRRPAQARRHGLGVLSIRRPRTA
jgi:hypothetical protein